MSWLRCGVLSVGAMIAFASARAQAAGPLPAQSEPIQTSSYRIDMFQGPVLAGTRVTGLGGAYAAVADGVEGNALNAASPAVRVPWSVDWFDYDATVSVTFPGSLRDTDFDNNGTKGFSYGSFWFGSAGANLQMGAWGLGATLDNQTYHLKGVSPGEGDPRYLSVSLQRGHLLGARSLLNGQLIVGLGARIANLSITASTKPDGNGDNQDLFRITGGAPEAGILFAPHRVPIRVAITGRAPVRAKPDPTSPTPPNSEGDTVVGSMYLPSQVELPWEWETGVSFQFGKRRLNVPWIDPRELQAPLVRHIEEARTARAGKLPARWEAQLRAAEEARMLASYHDARARLKARARNLPRHKLLLSTSLLVSGPVGDAVGVESFLRQKVDRSGQKLSITPRIGIEAEVVPDHLQVRFGNYLEPTRFRQGSPRLHFTTGIDLRLFNWSVFDLFDEHTYWRLSTVVDGATAYFGWGATIGIWH